MMWPFKKEETLPLEKVRMFSVIPPPGHYLAKNGVIRKAHTLREKLIANRIAQKKGSGAAYWDSVVRVVEEHYQETKSNQS